MAIALVFETHATTVDNELGRATGWLPGELSMAGRNQARELGTRRRDDGIAAVFSSDLDRAIQTAAIAFSGSGIPLLYDWRLRECDYGQLNGMPADEMHRGRAGHLDRPYPGGESWRQAVARVGRFLDDLPLRWDGQRVAIIGHVATRWGAWITSSMARRLRTSSDETSPGGKAGSTASARSRGTADVKIKPVIPNGFLAPPHPAT